MQPINRKFRLDIFLSPWLAFSLFLLIFNDYYLKVEFSNWFTGKLSDFSGLFLFSLFWFAFFPKKTLHVVITTAIFFSFWKSQLSQPAIDLWNGITGLYVGRVIDYTDLFSLLILPLARHHFMRFEQRPFREDFAIPAMVISLFAIMGTSIAPKHHIVSFEMQREADGLETHQLAYPWSMGYRDANLIDANCRVQEVMERHNFSCSNCDSQYTYRQYESDHIYIETNYNFSKRTIYIAIKGYLPEAVSGKEEPSAEEEILNKIASIRRDLMAALEPEFKNSTIVSDTYRFEHDMYSYRFRQITITAPDIRFHVLKNEYSIGNNNEKLNIIDEVLNDFLRDYSHKYASRSSCCDIPPYRYYYFGEAIGPYPDRWSNAISAKGTHGFMGRDTELLIDISQSLYGGILDVDKAAEKLAEALKEGLSADTHVEVSPSSDIRRFP